MYKKLREKILGEEIILFLYIVVIKWIEIEVEIIVESVVWMISLINLLI